MHSELAPTSSNSVGFAAFVGIIAASPGRSTPGSVPSTIIAVAIAAPVLPADTKPSAWPSLTSFIPILKELFFLRLTEVATGSSIAITSAASTNSMPRSPSPRQPQRLSSGSTLWAWPTRITLTPKSRVAASAPSISTCGAWSLPIASRTTFPVNGTCCFD